MTKSTRAERQPVASTTRPGNPVRLPGDWRRWLSAAAALLAVIGNAAVAQTSVPPAATDPIVAAGLYMERASDCMACHTRQGGTPFAGGRAIGTPFGTLYSTNITPDPDTGIGSWTDDQFYAALHDGIGHGLGYLYPVMPYTSYTRMTREDVLGIKAYLFSLRPVFSARPPNGLSFPFDIRDSLIAWRELFFSPGTFVANPSRSAEWNRGAYLVEGPGHCGECHSPRDLLGATETSASLSGGQVQQWVAPNISSDPLSGIGLRSIADIVTFLHTGTDKPLGEAFGPMGEVVHDSLRYLTEPDIAAIAVFLKDGPDRPETGPAADATRASLRHGRALYVQNCAQCHQDNGGGIQGVFPNLAGNAAVTADRPDDVAAAVLNGLVAPSGLRMPGFAGALTDLDIADIANYVRVSWGNKAAPDASMQLVAGIRALSPVGIAGSEAARAFDCPKVGGAAVPGALIGSADAQLFAGSDDATNRIQEILSQLRQQQPKPADGSLVNSMIAAMCPAVANSSGLSNQEKRARLMQLSRIVLEDIPGHR
nr:cytochrome c [uncultured Rhodopila sp.]